MDGGGSLLLLWTAEGPEVLRHRPSNSYGWEGGYANFTELLEEWVSELEDDLEFGDA
jgi:hypothetical protein